ncbi:hypothetical protein ACS0TY_029517 [Phlomoides rotata]
MGKRKTILIKDYRSSCMASKARNHKQSNLHNVDESMQQPPNLLTRTRVGARVHHGVDPNQATNSKLDASMHQPPNLLTRARVGGQVYNGVVPNQTIDSQLDALTQQPPNLLARARVGGRVYNGVVSNQVIHSQHDDLTQQNDIDITNETNDIQTIRSNNKPSREPPSTKSKTRKSKQSKFNLSDSPIQQPPILMHNHMEANQASNSEDEQPSQQSTHEISNGSNEVQHAESCDEGIVRKARGPTYMLKIWGRPSTLPLIKVDFDGYGRPIGENKSAFTEFLGTIARKGTYCPIDVENWHKMPKQNKKYMIQIIKEKYDISLADEDWILHSINEKWKSWKSFLKARYFMPNKTVEFLMDEKPERVAEDQWKNIVTYWNRADVQEQSEKKKEARSNKKMDHRTGKKSFAQIHANMTKEKGRAPFRSEMFEVCYTPANGAPSIDVVKYLDSMKELTDQLPEGSYDSVGPNDIFAQVTGQDKPGYVRMFGGVSASDVWGEGSGRKPNKRKMLEQQSEISEMKNQIAELKALLVSQQRFISQQPQGSTSLSTSLPGIVPTKQTLRV